MPTRCRSGKHVWLDATNARFCCNGYSRVLSIGDVAGCSVVASEALPGGQIYGYAWVRVPATDKPPRT